MRRRFLLTSLAALVAAANAQSALAAQQASIGQDSTCISAQFDAEDDERLFSAATQAPPDQEAMIAVVAPAAQRCSRRYDWGRSRFETALAHSMAAMLARHSTVVLTRAGIQVATLDRWFRSLSEHMRATLQTTTIVELALVQALAGDGVSDSVVETNQRAISGYLAYLLLTERIDRGLPLDPG